VADVPSGLSLTPPQESNNERTNMKYFALRDINRSRLTENEA
jgi:hypothetical protein